MNGSNPELPREDMEKAVQNGWLKLCEEYLELGLIKGNVIHLRDREEGLTLAMRVINNFHLNPSSNNYRMVSLVLNHPGFKEGWEIADREGKTTKDYLKYLKPLQDKALALCLLAEECVKDHLLDGEDMSRAISGLIICDYFMDLPSTVLLSSLCCIQPVLSIGSDKLVR